MEEEEISVNASPRFKPRPPKINITRADGNVSSEHDSDILDQRKISRSPRINHIKAKSARENKAYNKIDTITTENKTCEEKEVQSDYAGSGTFSVSMNTQAIKRYAEAGNPQAQNEYANRLMNGVDIPVDKDKALIYYKLAADNGVASAAYKYAIIFMDRNINSSQNIRESVSYIERSAHLGYMEGQYEYARILLAGNHTAQNIELGIEYLTKSANNGCAKSQYKLSDVYLKGKYVNQNIKTGIRYLKKAAGQRYPPAMNRLAQLLEHGEFVEQNLPKCIELYKSAAEGGNSDAQNAYATILLQGEYGVEQNRQEALAYLELAAAQDHPFALFNLSNLYIGNNATSDKGLDYLRKSAFAGYEKALYNLGLVYEKGKLVSKDFSKAAHYFELAANKGERRAMCNYAAMLLVGRGVEKDQQKAAELFKAAADKGSCAAQYRYALLLEKSPDKALYRKSITDYYTMSARGGNAKAAMNVAKIIELTDKKAAMEFYDLAAKSGNKEAVFRLALLQEHFGLKWRANMEIAARHGFDEAKIHIAVDDLSVGSKRDRALAILEKYAKSGSPVAQYHYAIEIYKDDEDKSIEYLTQAENSGSVLASRKLGDINTEHSNIPEAFKHYYKASEHGDSLSQYICASLLETHKKNLKCPVSMYSLYESSAKSGNVSAQFRYAKMLDSGEGVVKSRAESIKYLKLAASSGHVEAALLAAKLLLETQSREAAHFAKMAADSEPDNPETLLVYGKVLHNGFGCGEDTQRAVKLMRRSAELGNVEAKYLCGIMYMDGDGVGKDEKVGIDYLEAAAEAKFELAYVALAEYYDMKSDGKSIQLAKKYYGLGSDCGHSDCMRRYAELIKDNDSSKYRQLMEKSSELNNVLAKYRYAKIIKNKDEIKRLVSDSAEHGLVSAQADLGASGAKYIEYLERATKAGNKRAALALAKHLEKSDPYRSKALMDRFMSSN